MPDNAPDPAAGWLNRHVTGHEAQTRVRLAIVAVRATATVLVASSILFGSTTTGPSRHVQLVCLAVGVAAALGWGAWFQRSLAHPAKRLERVLLALFMVMAATAVAAMTAHGGSLIFFALIGVAGAGACDTLLGAWSVAGVAILAVVVGAIGASATPLNALGDCLEVVVALLFGRSRRSYRIRAEQSAQLLAQAEQLRVEQAEVATLRERTRIAREIHDVLAHSLGALNIQIQAASALLSEQGDRVKAAAVLERAHRIATEGLHETRRAVHALRADLRPLDAQLAELAEEHRATHEVTVDVGLAGESGPLAADATVALLRVAQESLVNAAKHAAGAPVQVTLTYGDATVRLRVSNPLGCSTGGEPDQLLSTIDGGYGLRGMRERLLLLRGTLTAGSGDGRWDVTAEVPR